MFYVNSETILNHDHFFSPYIVESYPHQKKKIILKIPNKDNNYSDIKIPILPACYTPFVLKPLSNFLFLAIVVFTVYAL